MLKESSNNHMQSFTFSELDERAKENSSRLYANDVVSSPSFRDIWGDYFLGMAQSIFDQDGWRFTKRGDRIA